MNYMDPLLYRYLLEKVAFNPLGAPKKDEIAEKALQNALNFLKRIGGIKEVPAATPEKTLRNLSPFLGQWDYPRSVTDLSPSQLAELETEVKGLPTPASQDFVPLKPPDLSSLLIPTPADPSNALSLLARVLAGSATKNTPSDVNALLKKWFPHLALPLASANQDNSELSLLSDERRSRMLSNLSKFHTEGEGPGFLRQLYDNLTSSDSWKKLLTADHWKGITTADFWKDPATLLTLLALLGTVGAVGGGGYAAYRYLSDDSGDKKKKKKKSEETKSAAVRQKAAALRAVLDVVDL